MIFPTFRATFIRGHHLLELLARLTIFFHRPALPKALEYFRIKDPPYFRKVFKEFILSKITTANELVNWPPPRVKPANPKRLSTLSLVSTPGFPTSQWSFSGSTLAMRRRSGVNNKTPSSSVTLVPNGKHYGPPGWEGVFKEVIHGIFLIVAYSEKVATTFVQEFKNKLLLTPNRSCIQKLYGSSRVGTEDWIIILGTEEGCPIFELLALPSRTGCGTQACPLYLEGWSKGGSFLWSLAN